MGEYTRLTALGPSAAFLVWAAVAILFILLTVFKKGIVAPGLASGAVIACLMGIKETGLRMQLSTFVIASVIMIVLIRAVTERRHKK